MKIKNLLSAVALFAASVTTASAATYAYTGDPNRVGNGGSVSALSSTYNSDTERLTWSVSDAKTANGQAADGFWLVINGSGPNPKSIAPNTLAVLYADFSSSKLLAYSYNAQNNTTSVAGTLLQDFSSDLSVSGNTFGFDIDVSGLNSMFAAPWEGMAYGDLIGVWFHFASGTSLTPGQSFNFNQQAWYDTAFEKPEQTTVVPIPAAAFLFAPVLAGFMATRRRLKAK
jgi:hypothetical protein